MEQFWPKTSIESIFGGTEEEEKVVKELEEGPIAANNHHSEPGGANDDVRKEYGYKYDDDDHNDDDDDGSEAFNPDDDNNKTMDQRLLPLHQSTAVITKTQERIPYVYVLGRTYHPVHEYHLRKQFESSLFWFTYRCDFPEIVPYRITSDAGWGCMLRSAQMLLAHTLRIHFKSKHWKPSKSLAKSRDDSFLMSLMTWFADFPSKDESVYSLHNMVAAGFAKYEVLPGEWYGPGTACYVLRDLVALHQRTQPSLFRVHVCEQGTVYKSAVHQLMTKDSKRRAEERQQQQPEQTTPTPLHPLDPTVPPPSSLSPALEDLEWDTSLLLLVPLRLGLDTFNEDYVQSLARSFWLPQSVGVLGGRPRGARWFYGAYADGSKVLGLDPHTVQSSPQRRRVHSGSGDKNSVVDISDEYMRSVHTPYPEVYPLHRMDPSIAIGFYCRDKKEFAALEQALMEVKAATTQASPDLFTFAEHAPDYVLSSSSMGDSMLGEDVGPSGTSALDAVESDDEEEYVLL